MRALIVCDQQGDFNKEVTVEEISNLLEQKEVTFWLDIADPTDADIALLRDEFHFHPLAIEDTTRTHERPKVDAYPDYYFIVLYAAQYDEQSKQLMVLPINIFVGKNFLVSVYKGAIREVDDTLARWQA